MESRETNHVVSQGEGYEFVAPNLVQINNEHNKNIQVVVSVLTPDQVKEIELKEDKKKSSDEKG